MKCLSYIYLIKAQRGRIYYTLYCIANWVEWTGARIFNVLVNSSAQRLGIGDLNDEVIFNLYYFLNGCASAMFIYCFLFAFTREAFLRLGRILNVLHIISHVLVSKIFLAGIANFIRHINRKYFRWVPYFNNVQ